MPELGEHFCSACGAQHGGEQRAVPEVEIARIHANRDIQIARLEYREGLEGLALEAETAVVIAELETESAVAVAEETGPPDGQGEEPGAAPIVVEAPPAEEPEEPAPDMAPPGVVDTGTSSPSSGPRSNDSGWWSGYR